MKESFTHLKHCILSPEQIQRLYEHLSEREFIERNITSDEFLFLLSGSGTPTVKRIKWKASITLLSIYLYEIRDPLYRPEWSIAERIFENIKASSLRDNHSRPASKDASRSFDTFFDNQKDVRNLISSW